MTGDCIHFNGTQHERCKAGVRYSDARVERVGRPRGLPCLARQIGGGERPDSCNCYEPTSPLLAALIERESAEAIAAVLAGACPQCLVTCERDEGERTTVLTCAEHGFVSRECRRIGEPRGADQCRRAGEGRRRVAGRVSVVLYHDGSWGTSSAWGGCWR